MMSLAIGNVLEIGTRDHKDRLTCSNAPLLAKSNRSAGQSWHENPYPSIRHYSFEFISRILIVASSLLRPLAYFVIPNLCRTTSTPSGSQTPSRTPSRTILVQILFPHTHTSTPSRAAQECSSRFPTRRFFSSPLSVAHGQRLSPLFVVGYQGVPSLTWRRAIWCSVAWVPGTMFMQYMDELTGLSMRVRKSGRLSHTLRFSGRYLRCMTQKKQETKTRTLY
ncbi:hypothetical protein BDP27DRAFT_1070900 [Rhodocollybia butyracea]|uniref:Uncharacterized protein n=1 Tax=Rhodocollybia butyracea TaxID=206335 RepID=A0A9P5PNP0_9AGAR|nr:hypothetical protein BDP27DRAFT_1070900 [Rhodocollybia butyracea]